MTATPFTLWSQDAAGLDGVHQAVAQAGTLEPGEPVERALKGGEAHSYRVTLGADQYLSVVIEQRGVDLSAKILGPDGSKQAEADDALGRQGVETLTFISGTAADYRLEVSASERNAAIGQYEIRIVARRAPTADERRLEDARRQLEASRTLRHEGKYDAALPPAERALAIRESVLGGEHKAVADALHQIALLYDDTNQYAKAEPLNQRALAIREKALGPDHPDVARSLFNLAWLVKSKGDFARTEALYRRALAIQEKALGPDHPEVATTLNDLAVLFKQKGSHEQAIQLNQRVLAIRERALGPNDPSVAKALNNLAKVYEDKADYPQAELLLTRALTIWEKALGPDHPEVAFALDSLATVLAFKGDYAAAEPLYQRALAIREKALGPDHPEVATTLNNLGVLYRQMGDYAKAESLLQRDLAITEKRLGPTHRFVAPTLTNLAAIYRLQGEDERAESLLRRALTIQESALGPAHANVGATLSQLGQLYSRGGPGRGAQAESFFERSLAILETALGPEHPRVASPLGGLAGLAAAHGDRARAESLYRRALAIQEKRLGPDHPEVAQSLESLAALYGAQGDLPRSLQLLSRAAEIREHDLAHNLPLGSERQKVGYLRLFELDIDRALTLQAQSAPGDPRALDLALSTVLRRKGRALDATSDNVAILRLRASPQDRELFARLAGARSQLSAMTLQGAQRVRPDAYGPRLRQLEEAVDRLEGDVAARSAEFRAQSRPITLDAVRAAIPDGSVLVEFAWYRPVAEMEGRPVSPRYVAFLLAARGGPRWLDLGEAATIDRAAEEWRSALRDPRRTDVEELGRALDAKIMQPVRSMLGTTTHLLLSPDGALNLLPFAAFVDEDGRKLVERYSITYLTSGRDLLRLQVPRKARSGLVVVAAPAFGDPALVKTPRAGLTGQETVAAQVDYSQVFFGPLPGVGDEVSALKTLLPRATFLVGEQATEAALRRLGGPRILHIATHGFFLVDDDAPRDPQPAGARLGKWTARADNPLLRSGLALAGANQGRSGDDEGVLTALEAAGLDLWGTKLVVLSACDTGVGDVKRGDGVYGLRRALVLAGSESQLMSLWAVSDRSTRDLMIGYYKRLTTGEGRGEALRQAQLKMLGDGRHTHPYYWAGFIQSGEWANLDGRR